MGNGHTRDTSQERTVTLPMRMLGVVIAVVALLLMAGALWAQYGSYGSQSEPMAKPEAGMTAKPETGMMPAAKEFERCTKTCTLLMDNYHKMYPTMRAHEGDKRCWSTCWSRYGERSNPTADEQKGMWMKQMSGRMHANQCAQACWRVHHDDSKEVAVGGWRSVPREVGCAH